MAKTDTDEEGKIHPMKTALRNALSVALLSLPLGAGAACPDGQAPAAEQLLHHANKSFRAELCQLDTAPAGVRPSLHGHFRLALYLRQGEQERLQVESIEPIDVEGELRGLSLDRAIYELHGERPTVAVLVQSRFHGEQIDQVLGDLQLYMPAGKTLQRVANIQVSRESWGTNCQGDCPDSVNSKTLVVLGRRGADGYRELILRNRTRLVEAGKGMHKQSQQETRMNWNGSQYESP